MHVHSREEKSLGRQVISSPRRNGTFTMEARTLCQEGRVQAQVRRGVGTAGATRRHAAACRGVMRRGVGRANPRRALKTKQRFNLTASDGKSAGLEQPAWRPPTGAEDEKQEHQ